jgi:cAMP-dependent protein kinase regulator
MDSYERSKIADAIKSVDFKAGDFVVKEGDSGDEFFMVEEG